VRDWERGCSSLLVVGGIVDVVAAMGEDMVKSTGVWGLDPEPERFIAVVLRVG